MKRWIGPAMMGVGTVVLLIGLVLMITDGDADDIAAETTTTTVETVDSTTTTSPPETTTTTAASAETTTTGVPAETTTTTTTVPDETVEDFVQVFAAAIDDGDREFVLDRLHPVVIEGWGEDLCTAWVDREIMTLSDYELVEVTSGPADATVETPNGTLAVDDMYEAAVSFVFQGQPFDSGGSYAPIDGVMYWLGQCR